MSEGFTSAHVKSPPEGKVVEGRRGGDIIKCIKRDGSWENEDGVNILIDEWRLIEKPKEGEPPPPPPPERPKKTAVPRYTVPARKAPRKKK